MSATIRAASASPSSRERRHTGPLLVAVGENGLHVLRAAATLAPALGDHVHVFSAIEPLPIEVFAGEPALMPPSFEEGRRETRLEQLVDRVGKLVDPEHRWPIVVEHGDPPSAICRRARELDASLLVVGIGRHHPIDRIISGETTLRVIRRASCPVLAVAGELDHLPREVVVATDFSGPCALAVEAVLPLLAPRATLHLLHAWEPSASADPTVFDAQESYSGALPARFARFIAALRLPAGIEVRTEVREGKVVPQILAFAESRHADLVVAGRHGLNAIARLFVGSVTTGLVRGATCSVLVTPEPSVVQLDRMQQALTGTSEIRSPDRWAEQLTAFARRNDGRRTTLEVDDPAIGAQTQETGYALMGASYDRHDGCVELMLGVPRARTPHLTRNIADVDAIAVLSDATGQDLGLRIHHGDGQTLLLLAPEP